MRTKNEYVFPSMELLQKHIEKPAHLDTGIQTIVKLKISYDIRWSS
ncbi:hypothetical protein M3936_23990 [Sutcliffiella horikoshii]|nr:hypothetical protein [Sutcliffiella horikoshii]MCM3620612.1 hypothetical protein [Sutcliffiella horikoshii]